MALFKRGPFLVSLHQEMATDSSIPAWRILGQESLVRYSPLGHKELDMTEQHTHTEHVLEKVKIQDK